VALCENPYAAGFYGQPAAMVTKRLQLLYAQPQDFDCTLLTSNPHMTITWWPMLALACARASVDALPVLGLAARCRCSA
jgi:hypothetical protein